MSIRRIKQFVLARWRSKPKNNPEYEDEEHSLQGKTGKVTILLILILFSHFPLLPSLKLPQKKLTNWAIFYFTDSRYLLKKNKKRNEPFPTSYEFYFGGLAN